MTEVLLQAPVAQFCDPNGAPYAGGTIATFVVNTTTPKSTWQDALGAVLNTNPIVLDAAGRAIIYGDGAYRFVLKDGDGNLIWDLPTSSLVSAAMAPVVEAATLSDARDALGITALLDAESAARAAADAAETTRAESAEGTLYSDIVAETARAEAAEATLTSALAAEVARAEAAEAALGASIGALGGPVSVRTGTGTSDGTGKFVISFSPVFTNDLLYFAAWKLPSTAGVAGIYEKQYFDGTLGPGLTGTVQLQVIMYDLSSTIQPAGSSGITGFLLDVPFNADYVGNFGWLAWGY